MTDKEDSSAPPKPAAATDDKTRIVPSLKKPVDEKTRLAKTGAAKQDEATVFSPRKAKGSSDPAPQTPAPEQKPVGSDNKRIKTQFKSSQLPRESADAVDNLTPHYTQYRSSTTANNSSGFAKASELARQAMTGSGTGTLLKKRFLLEDALGQGGMGTVYKTKDLRKVEAEDPNPYIATKVLNQDFRDHPDAFVTLQQEAAKSQTLAHPNIVTVHDFDRDGDVLFMTMELLEGEPLDKLLRAHRDQGLATTTALKLTRDLCAALTYAHKRHLIHADFKPGNVFVMADGSAKVLDFGIARAATKETQGHKFDAGQLGALTPAYATIEMINDEPISFADDVYALACVVYEMLAGRHPYKSLSAFDAKEQKLKPKRIEKLTAQQWKALNHALALEKSQRTPTVAEFNAELFPSRKPLAVKIALVLLPLSLMGGGWFAYSHYQAEAQLQKTIDEKLAQAQACFAKRDFACAVEQSLVVTNLDANNPAAIELLQTSQQAYKSAQHQQNVDRLLSEAEACMSEQDFACAKIKARELLTLDAENSRAEKLLRDSSESLDISRLAQRADSCLQNNDLSCAEALLVKAQAINANHNTTLILQNQLLAAQTGARQQQSQVEQYLASARSCLLQKQFACAAAQANNAISIDPNNAQAIEIKHSASVAERQQADAEKKVANMLAQARTCLDKTKNYSCAIAKAEAALDIIPDHREAAEIKQRAQETQRQLKSGFTIQ